MDNGNKQKKSLIELERAICNLLGAEPLYKVSEVAKALEVDPRTIYRDIETLGLELVKLGPKSSRLTGKQARKLANLRGKSFDDLSLGSK